MPVIQGKYVSPYYNDVPGFVKEELKYRASKYGNRIRSVAPSETRDEGAERLLWSYGKVAWAQVHPKKGGIPLGTGTSKLMSGRDGKLLLYDQQRNVPNFPLLQSLTISNEGTMGSLIKASFDFIVFPNYTANGFSMKGIEDSYFKPGRDVRVRWGWSVREKNKANYGQFEGIVYNFEWSVNNDLSITGKCSLVSKGSIALGISGEQNNPDANDNEIKDPLGNQVYDTDIAGVVEQDVIQFGGTKNTSVSLTAGNQSSTITGLVRNGENPLTYILIAIPRSLRDADPDTLSQDQKDKQAADKEALEEANKKNAAILTYAEPIAVQQNIFAESQKKITELRNLQNRTAEQNAQIRNLVKQSEDARLKVRDLIDKAKDAADDGGFFENLFSDDPAKFEQNLKNAANAIQAAKAAAAKAAAASGGNASAAASGGTQPTKPAYNVDTPEPIVEPTYYIPLKALVNWFNGKLKKNAGPLGSIASVEVEGNLTQYLPDIVSCTPDKVYFPDDLMGTYGTFQPFQTSWKKGAQGTDINIGDILISTTCIAETYREFLQENQTNITYKNITGFWDSIIKKVNYASGETYQLTVRVVEPTSIGQGSNERAILSIEDSNIPTSVTVDPYQFEATIAKPILKSINISSKPPGPLAAAAFATARKPDGVQAKSQPIDVKVSKDGSTSETNAAKTAISDIKGQLIKVGVSDKFAQDLKGAYSTYKRAQSDARNAHWLNKAIYPVELSLTIDGINGFHFGNVITTNLIPSQYKDEKLVFTVVKVNHTIKDGVWETSLETKSRLLGGTRTR